MFKKKLLIALLAQVAFAGSLFASDEHVYIMGAGKTSCGQYLKYRGEKNRVADALHIEWAKGFINGHDVMAFAHPNAFQIGKDRFPDHATILAFSDKYCRDHPLDIFYNAISQLINDLGGWRWDKK